MSLKSRRSESGLTQRQAAEIFGIKYRTYQNYENGVTSPDMNTAAKFARYFSCTIGDLFDLEEGTKSFLSDDEIELIGLYRDMSEKNRSLLIEIARAFCGKVS